jgi:hypothetical protein
MYTLPVVAVYFSELPHVLDKVISGVSFDCFACGMFEQSVGDVHGIATVELGQ